MKYTHISGSAYKALQALAIFFALIGPLFSIARAETPKVFWHSQPVKPNETVMVQGHAISPTTLVDAQRLDDGSPGFPLPKTGAILYNSTRITPLSFGDSLLNFVVPSRWQYGVFAYRLVNDSVGTIHLVNAPDPWFLHGDQGSRSTPGGWVAIYGNTLALTGGTPQLGLVSSTGVVLPLITARSGGNPYAQYFDLPIEVPVGSYDVYVHNGFGGPPAWVRLSANETINSDKLKIVSRSGLWETVARAQPEVVIDALNGNGGASNWDAVFASAIATVKVRKDVDNKPLGGVIRVKPGVYTLDKYLVLPDKTILVGENKATTILQWGESATPDPDGRNPLIMGETLVVWPAVRGTFSIEDLTLARTSTARVGVCIERALTVTEEQSAWFRRIVCQEPNTAETALSAILNNTASNWFHNRPSFWIYLTKNTEITDSTLDTITGITLMGHGSATEFVRIENNTLRWRLAPFNAIYGLKNLIYTGNTEEMLGSEAGNGTNGWADVGDAIGTFGHNNRDVYFAKNYMKREIPGTPYQQMGFTLDGNAGVYFGKVSSISGTRIDLTGTTSGLDQYNRVRAQKGAMVQIISGKGAGQWRHLMSPVLDATGTVGVSTVYIDIPWDIEPDTTSWLSINDFQGRMIFYGNNLENAPKLQPYYASHDVIITENLLCTTQTAVLPVWVGYRGNGYGNMTLGWHYQVIDNIVGYMGVSMATVITSLDKNEPLDPKSGSSPGYDGPYVSTHIYRNNRNVSSAFFEIGPGDQNTGFLIENNLGLSSLSFLAPPYKQEMGLVRNNTSPEGNRPQLFQNNQGQVVFPMDPGVDVKLSYTNDSIVNLARSGLASAVNDFGGYGRINPIDGDTGSSWGINGMATSGPANQAWIQVDLRTSNVIQSVKIWPRLDANNETADVWVLVSPTPFSSNVLDTEKARPEVFSQFLSGKFSGARTVLLPTTLSGGRYIGRYVRAWKVFPQGVTGQLQFAEIEVFGYSALDLGVTVSADTSTVTQGGTVNYTVTVTNYGSNPATNVTTTGTLASCDLGTVSSQASASCTRSVVASAVGPLTQTVSVSASEPESNLTTGNNSATVTTNVQALMSVVKTGTGTGVVASGQAGINCGADCTEPYDANTVVNLTAAADANSLFSGWGGACSGTSNSCTVTMDASKSVEATFNVKTANLAISNTVNTTPVLVNDNIIYTLQVTNMGPQTASAATLRDTIPAGTGFVSASSSQGSCSGTSSVNCALGTLNNGASATVTLTVNGMSAGSKSNTATVSALESDPITANNSATATAAVLASCVGSTGKNISGATKASDGTALSGVNILLIRTSTTPQCGNRVPTGSNGSYQFSKLSGATYSVTPSKTGCTGFTPASLAVTLSNGNKTGQNFIGACP